MEFTLTSAQIIGFCSFVAALWGVWKIIKELKKPNDELKQMVADHEKLLSADDERLRAIEESNKMILQSLLVIINHNITGNGVDKMKEARSDLEEYLINK
jgi:hypothetical protein